MQKIMQKKKIKLKFEKLIKNINWERTSNNSVIAACCADVNECKSADRNQCDQLCANMVGGYRCFCHAGYAIYTDNRTCEGTPPPQ